MACCLSRLEVFRSFLLGPGCDRLLGAAKDSSLGRFLSFWDIFRREGGENAQVMLLFGQKIAIFRPISALFLQQISAESCQNNIETASVSRKSETESSTDSLIKKNCKKY